MFWGMLEVSKPTVAGASDARWLIQCFAAVLQVAASPIPHLLLPKFRSSRSTLLQMLSKSLAMGDFEGTVVVQLLHG
jgi:predicted MarR family transcription regulator